MQILIWRRISLLLIILPFCITKSKYTAWKKSLGSPYSTIYWKGFLQTRSVFILSMDSRWLFQHSWLWCFEIPFDLFFANDADESLLHYIMEHLYMTLWCLMIGVFFNNPNPRCSDVLKKKLSLPVVESPTFKPTPYTHSGQEVAMVNNKALLKPKEKHLRNDVLKFGFNKLLEDCTGDIFSCQLCH